MLSFRVQKVVGCRRLDCQNYYMDFSDLLYGFVEIDVWISLCYMDLSELIHTWTSLIRVVIAFFVEVAT